MRPPLSYTEPLNRRLLVLYGYGGQPLARFQLDHLIPISIGGAPRAQTNLWPERTGNRDGYQAKDRFETALARAVCNRRTGLHAAQRAIKRNWRCALARLHLAPLPANASSSADGER